MTSCMHGLALGLALAALPGAAASTPRPAQAPAGQDERAAPDPQSRVDALVERYEQAQRAFYERLDQAGSEEEQMRLYEEENPLGGFVDEFKALASELDGDAAASAWIWVVRLGPQHSRIDEARQALGCLTAQHVSSPTMAELALELRYGSYSLGRTSALAALRAIHAKTPIADVKATAQFVLATVLMVEPSQEEKVEARALLVELAEGAGDVGEVRWADRAAATLFELDRLQIGMVAPDFEAVDQDGVAWKLSDYRGKVVVLDFWGFW